MTHPSVGYDEDFYPDSDKGRNALLSTILNSALVPRTSFYYRKKMAASLEEPTNREIQTQSEAQLDATDLVFNLTLDIVNDNIDAAAELHILASGMAKLPKAAHDKRKRELVSQIKSDPVGFLTDAIERYHGMAEAMANPRGPSAQTILQSRTHEEQRTLQLKATAWREMKTEMAEMLADPLKKIPETGGRYGRQTGHGFTLGPATNYRNAPSLQPLEL